jgi:hypothetical protein
VSRRSSSVRVLVALWHAGAPSSFAILRPSGGLRLVLPNSSLVCLLPDSGIFVMQLNGGRGGP